MVKRISKITLYGTLLFLAALAGAAAFTQTSLFRDGLRSTLYNVLKNNVNAAFYLGEIQGNLFTGFSIDTLLVYVNDAPFIESGKISVRYDPLKLFKNNATIVSAVIENPSIHITRFKNGMWNVAMLSNVSAEPDSSPSSFRADIKDFEIRNAIFSLIDSTGDFEAKVFDEAGEPSLNYSNIKLQKVHIRLSGFYTEKKQEAQIRNISFESPRQKFTLQEFSASIVHDTAHSVMNNVVIKTPDSHLKFSAQMNGVGVFAIPSLEMMEHLPLWLTMERSTVAFRDLQVFLPELYFLKGSVDIESKMSGEFGNINIEKLNADFGTTHIRLLGTVSKLHTPEKLYLDITSLNSIIEPTDAPKLLPFFNIPNYPGLGQSTFDFRYQGEPLNFAVDGTLKTPAGNAAIQYAMDIRKPELEYSSQVKFFNINLEKIFSRRDLYSNLSGELTLQGSGVSIEELNSTASIQLDSSYFYNVLFTRAELDVSAKNKILEWKFSSYSPEGDIRATSIFNYTRGDIPEYNLNAKIRQANFAKILRDKKYTSELSFNLQLQANSFIPFNGSSEIQIDFLPSTYNQYAFDSAGAFCSIKENNGYRTIDVESPLADISISGDFEFNRLLQNLAVQAKNFEQFYSYQRRIIDTSFVVVQDTNSAYEEKFTEQSMLEYTVRVKNLKPIAIVLGLPEFDAIGSLRGLLRETADDISFTASGKIDHAYFADTTAPVGISNGEIDLRFTNDQERKTSFDSLSASVQLYGKEIIAGATTLRQPNVTIELKRRHGTFSLSSDVDSTISFAANGNFAVTDTRDSIQFSTMYLRYFGFDVRALTPVTISLSSDGIVVDSSIFGHREERFTLAGKLGFDNSLQAAASISNFDISDLYFFARSKEFQEQALMLGGNVNGKISVAGSLENPEIHFQGDAINISHRSTTIGNCTAELLYKEKTAAVYAQLFNFNDTIQHTIAEVRGTIPIDLSFLETASRIDREGLDLFVHTNQLQISAIDPFISELVNVSGSLDVSISLAGSLAVPQFNGSAVLNNGSFTMDMTGITYNAFGEIVFDKNKIFLDRVNVTNLTSDYAKGKVNLGGYIVLKGFLPNEYHISAKGELLVMLERSRTLTSSFYGNLIGGTDENGLRFEGSPEQSRIIGTALIKQSNLVFPPTQQATSYSFEKYTGVIFVNDTVKKSVDTVKIIPVIQAIQQAIQTAANGKEKTFADNFGYELTIHTQGNVRINLIFNNTAGSYEELYAELNGKLTLLKDFRGVQLRGTINVGNESKYTFYKNFVASGSLIFIGPPDNPQLNITAKYEGTHCVGAGLSKDECKKEERVVVTLNISGTRAVPKVKMGLAILDQDGKEIPRAGDVENDAISFLLTSSPGTPGKFRDDLTAQDRQRITEQITQSIGGTYLNQMLSGYVMEFIQKNNVPFVKRFEVRQVGADPDIGITGEYNEIIVNLGGRVFSDINNANFSVQIPLERRRRNFMLEVEKKTENLDYTIQARTTLGARIYYRFTF